MNDDIFYITLAIMLVTALIASPIASVILLLGVRRRQLSQAQELQALQDRLRRLQPQHQEPIQQSATAVQPPPMPAAPRPATPQPAPSLKPGPVLQAPTPQPTAAAASTTTTATTATAPSKQQAAWKPLPPAPIPEREPNRFETAARETLSAIWNWIIVSEEHRRPGMTAEQAVAINWLIRIGVPILIAGILFFLKYSSDAGWLQAQAKVSLTLLTGAGLLGTGIHLLGKRYDLIGQGLMGAGLAALYGAIFAAANIYDLIGPLPAFALMACVTVGAGFMSVRFNSLLMAILGIVGGYGTPVLLATGSGNLVALYAYMLLLGIGVLGIARHRGWHLLNAMAFAATWALVLVSLNSYYEPTDFWRVIPFLAAFFVLFSTITFIHQLLEGIQASILELLLLLLNAALFFGIGHTLIGDSFDPHWSALLTLSLAAFYTAHLYLFMSRKRRDRNLALGFLALAAFFLIITLPLLLSDQWLTLSWSAQALVLLWLAAKLDSRFLRYVAYLLYLIVAGRFLTVDLVAQFSKPLAADTTLAGYGLILLERLVSFGVPVASIALGMKLHIGTATTAAPLTLGSENDIRDILPRRPALVATAILLFGMLFLYLHLEINRTVMFVYDPLRLPSLTILWIAAALLMLFLYDRLLHQALLVVFCLFVIGTLAKITFVDLPFWNISPIEYRFRGDSYSFLQAGMRLLDFGIILAFLLYAFGLFRRRHARQHLHLLFGYGALAFLLFYMTFEWNTFLGHFVKGLQAGGISLLWALFALGLIIGGIMRAVRPLRFAGLALFLVAAAKVILYDLQNLDALYRIVAFILLGIVLLAGAFVYITFEARLQAARPTPPDPAP